MLNIAIFALPFVLLGLAVITNLIFTSTTSMSYPMHTDSALSPDNSIIVFDLHGVIFRPNYLHILRLCLGSKKTLILVRQLTRPAIIRDLYRLWSTNMVIENYIMTIAQQHPKLRPCIPLLIELGNAQTPIKPTVHLIEQLKQQGYTLHILSNIGQHFLEDLRTKHATIFAHFDAIKVANKHEEYIGKPDPRIFYNYLLQHNPHNKQVVFIDDKKKNITAAERAGMIGILCQKPDQLQEYLERMLMFTAL